MKEYRVKYIDDGGSAEATLYRRFLWIWWPVNGCGGTWKGEVKRQADFWADKYHTPLIVE